MTQFNDFFEEQLRDPVLKKEYDALEAEFSIMQALTMPGSKVALRKSSLRSVPALPRPTSADWKGKPAIRH